MTKWPILKTGVETYIKTDTFELYVGDTDTITPEEWRTIATIAHAPALLAASKELLVKLDSIWDFGTTPTPSEPLDWLDDLLSEEIIRLRDAIAQAEQEAQ